MKYFTVSLTVAIATLVSAVALAEGAADKSSDKMSGNIHFMSNFFEDGLSQSQGNPALKAGLVFPLGPQFKLGLTGATVQYADSNATTMLTPDANAKININSNVSFGLGWAYKSYFASSAHNTQMITFSIDILGYDFEVAKQDNWDNTGSDGTRYGIAKEFHMTGDLYSKLNGGYDTISASGFTSYFDLEAILGYKLWSLNWELKGYLNSVPSQFGSRSQPTVAAEIGAYF